VEGAGAYVVAGLRMEPGRVSAGRTAAGRAGRPPYWRRAGRVLVLAAERFRAQDMLHHAAALTYPSVLSLFPALLLGVALLGLLGSQRTLDDVTALLTSYGADERVVRGVTAAARDAVEARTTSAVAVIVAVPLALLWASSAFVSATTALNVVLEADDRRSFIRRRLHALGATLVIILLTVGAVIAVFLGGALAAAALSAIGLGETAAGIWAIVRLPLGALLAMTAFAWMYYAAPTVPSPRWRWISLGAAIGVLVWLLASVGLFLFAANFETYNATYGAFATAILLLVWLWLTNVALLFGAEVNAAGRYTERTGTPLSAAGHSPEEAQHQAAKVQAGPARADLAAPAETAPAAQAGRRSSSSSRSSRHPSQGPGRAGYRAMWALPASASRGLRTQPARGSRHISQVGGPLG
jgi:membrane protein